MRLNLCISCVSVDAGSLLQSLLEGDFEAVLLSPQVKDLLTGDGSYDDEDIQAYLERRVLLYLSDASNDEQNSRELTVMALAVSCLHMFAQSNWTGPPLSLNLCNLLPAARLSSQKPLVEEIHSHLLLDGESVYSLVANPLLLLLARVILCKCSIQMQSLQLLPWWMLRYINLHQQILEAPSPQLLDLAHSCMEKVFKQPSLLSAQRTLTLQLHLECAYLSLTYYEYQAAKEHIRKAQELSGLSINLTGALGKRTRFQQKFLAQLILEVTKNQEGPDQRVDEASPTPLAILPKDCHLQDDTVLDEINLAEPDCYKLPDLSAEEQALILGICTDFQRNNPVHKLTEEELLAFTSCLLSQPKFWAVEVTALCLRTKLERGRTRCVERAMMQTQVSGKRPSSLIFTFSLSSLLVQAEEIVRRELEKKETPTLYCLLGDILKDHQYYDRAWELSGRRSARAMRSKALLHLRNKELQRCVECFEQSLKINTMQVQAASSELAQSVLKIKRKKEKILQILVRAVVENLNDSQGVPAGALSPKLKELLGRVSSRHSSDTEIWRQYALLYGDGCSDSPEDNDKALQFLTKAHRCEVQAGSWEKDPALFKEVIKRAIHMGQVTISCSEKKSNPAEALQMLSSTRLSLRSLVTKAKVNVSVLLGQRCDTVAQMLRIFFLIFFFFFLPSSLFISAVENLLVSHSWYCVDLKCSQKPFLL
uniref:Tetratricopeptide repeat protein 27 n=1 Tax=Oryzias sinensis TaxID=183150 RepID=A0A8C7XD45_9TELE